MDPTNGAGNPQAGTPQTPPTNGTDPQAGNAPVTGQTQAGNNPNTQPTPPASNPSTSSDPNGDDQPITLEKARELRSEARNLRQRATAAEAKLAELERANMTELERAKADALEAGKQLEATRKAVGVLALEGVAQKLGFNDATDAHQLAEKLEYDTDGRPKNAEALVRALLASKPHYANARNVAGNPTNPDRGQSTGGVGVFRMSQLADFDFYTKNEAAIRQALQQGKVIKD